MRSILELREASGLRPIDIAKALGVTAVTIWNWERRHHEPTASQVRALAQLFGVSMDEIDFAATQRRSRHKPTPHPPPPESAPRPED